MIFQLESKNISMSNIFSVETYMSYRVTVEILYTEEYNMAYRVKFAYIQDIFMTIDR